MNTKEMTSQGTEGRADNLTWEGSLSDGGAADALGQADSSNPLLPSANSSPSSNLSKGCGRSHCFDFSNTDVFSIDQLRSQLQAIQRAQNQLVLARSQCLAAIANRTSIANAEMIAIDELKLSRHKSKRCVRTATELQDEPEVKEGLLSGEISTEQADQIAKAKQEGEINVPEMAEAARTQGVEKFNKTMKRHQHEQSGDDGKSKLAWQRRKRKVNMFRDRDDEMFTIFGKFDDLSGARIEQEILARAEKLWYYENPKARRTHDHRLADALLGLICGEIDHEPKEWLVEVKQGPPPVGGTRVDGGGQGNTSQQGTNGGQDSSGGQGQNTNEERTSNVGENGSSGWKNIFAPNGDGRQGHSSAQRNSDRQAGTDGRRSGTRSGGNNKNGARSVNGSENGTADGQEFDDGPGNDNGQGFETGRRSSLGRGHGTSANGDGRQELSNGRSTDELQGNGGELAGTRGPRNGTRSGSSSEQGATGDQEFGGELGKGTNQELQAEQGSSLGRGHGTSANGGGRQERSNGQNIGGETGGDPNSRGKHKDHGHNNRGDDSEVFREPPRRSSGQSTSLLVIADYDVIAKKLKNPRLANGTRLPEDELVNLALKADILPAIFDAKQKPLWFGRSRRIATKEQRLALVARDQGCIYCATYHQWCQAHHVRWWQGNGHTDVANLVLVCNRCHHRIHELGHEVYQDPVTGEFTICEPVREGRKAAVSV